MREKYKFILFLVSGDITQKGYEKKRQRLLSQQSSLATSNSNGAQSIPLGAQGKIVVFRNFLEQNVKNLSKVG